MLKLGGKLILGVMLTLGTILSVGFYFVLDRQTNGMLEEVRNHTTSISQVVSSGVGEFLGEIQSQHDQLQEQTSYLALLSGVQSIEVLNEQRLVLSHSDSAMIGSQLDSQYNLVVDEVFSVGREIDVKLPEQGVVRRFIPIADGVKDVDVIGVAIVNLDYDDKLDEQADAVAYVIKGNMSRILRQVKDKRTSLNNLVDQIRGILEVMKLEVYNEQIMLLHQHGDSQWMDPVELSSNIKQVFTSNHSIEAGNYQQGYYQRFTPISEDGEVIGVVRLVMNLTPALEKIEQLSQTMRLIAVIVAVAIFFVLSWLMQRVIIIPVASLSESAKQLAKGHFNKVAVPTSNDEVAELGNSFNSMVDSLVDYRDKLLSANEYNENILRTMGDTLIVLNVQGMIEHVNDATLKLLGYQQRDDLIGFPLNLVCSDEPYCEERQLQFMLEGDEFNDREKYLITRNGSYIPVLLSFSHIRDHNGHIDGAVCVARDITERKRNERRLREAYDELEMRVEKRTAELFQEKERLQVTLRSIGDAVVTSNKLGMVEYVNPVAEKIIGSTYRELRGLPLEEVLPLYDELGEPLEVNPLEHHLNQTYCDITSVTHSMSILTQQQRMVAIESTMAPMLDNMGDVTGVVVVFRDVSEERQLRKQLLHQASHDALTGLSNRRVFEKRLGEALQMARNDQIEHAVLFLDLDQFKVVNDTCGHVAGDALLQQLTSLLRERMRVTDILARLGGDEFGVILHSCSLDHAKKVANVLLDTVREFRFIWEDKTFEVGVSIGLVMLDHNSESVAAVMSAADVACYAAKDGGRNRYHIYETSDKELKQRHGEMQWVTLISKAIKEDRFVLHLQEISSLSGVAGEPKHYELLIRMIGEKGELIPPGAFLPAAERYGLIGSVDRWVIENGLKSLASYLEKSPHRKGVFAINLSGLSVGDEGFLDYIKEQIELYQLPHHCICFEITETAAVANLTQASKFIKALRALGCKFALDDFGCGVSSFSYLKNLPVDFLKIDGMFVRDMVDDAIDYAMVEAINHIGQVMGLKTIAEFVESQAILDCLVALEVDYAQGYYIAEPTPLESIE